MVDVVEFIIENFGLIVVFLLVIIFYPLYMRRYVTKADEVINELKKIKEELCSKK